MNYIFRSIADDWNCTGLRNIVENFFFLLPSFFFLTNPDSLGYGQITEIIWAFQWLRGKAKHRPSEMSSWKCFYLALSLGSHFELQSPALLLPLIFCARFSLGSYLLMFPCWLPCYWLVLLSLVLLAGLSERHSFLHSPSRALKIDSDLLDEKLLLNWFYLMVY